MIESLKTTKNLRDVVKSSTTKNYCQSQINVKRQIVQFTRTYTTYSLRGNEFHTLKTLFFSICATWCLKAKSFLDSKVIKDVLFPFSHENLFKKEMRLATRHISSANKICENNSNKGWYSDITNGIVGNSATLQFAHGNIPWLHV